MKLVKHHVGKIFTQRIVKVRNDRYNRNKKKYGLHLFSERMGFLKNSIRESKSLHGLFCCSFLLFVIGELNMLNILQKARSHQSDRAMASFNEFKQLSEMTSKALKENPVAYEKIINAIDTDINEIGQLHTEVQQNKDDFIPLKTNKLSYLLQGARVFIEKHWQQIESGSIGDCCGEWGNTSLMNYAQTALLETLSLIRNNSKINDISDLIRAYIYQDSCSPNIQSIGSQVEGLLEGYSNSRWIGRDVSRNGTLRLHIPGLGYWFGGSRAMPEYEDKVYKNQDCSSWVAMLTEANALFSTAHILNITDPNQKSEYDVAAKEVLTPVPANEPFTGAIFCKKGHCGIVENYEEGADNFTLLSYSRMMPLYEGCIAQTYKYNDEGNKQATVNDDGLPWKLVQDYYGFDNSEAGCMGKLSDAYFYEFKDIVNVA